MIWAHRRFPENGRQPQEEGGYESGIDPLEAHFVHLEALPLKKFGHVASYARLAGAAFKRPDRHLVLSPCPMEMLYIMLAGKILRSDDLQLYYRINDLTSSRNSSLRKSPFSIKDWI